MKLYEHPWFLWQLLSRNKHEQTNPLAKSLPKKRGSIQNTFTSPKRVLMPSPTNPGHKLDKRQTSIIVYSDIIKHDRNQL